MSPKWSPALSSPSIRKVKSPVESVRDYFLQASPTPSMAVPGLFLSPEGTPSPSKYLVGKEARFWSLVQNLELTKDSKESMKKVNAKNPVPTVSSFARKIRRGEGVTARPAPVAQKVKDQSSEGTFVHARTNGATHERKQHSYQVTSPSKRAPLPLARKQDKAVRAVDLGYVRAAK
jgi:hypothetical protein